MKIVVTFLKLFTFVGNRIIKQCRSIYNGFNTGNEERDRPVCDVPKVKSKPNPEYGKTNRQHHH